MSCNHVPMPNSKRTCPGCRKRVALIDGCLDDHVGPNGLLVCRESGERYREATKRLEIRLATERVPQICEGVTRRRVAPQISEGDTRPQPFAIVQRPGVPRIHTPSVPLIH